MAMTDPARGGTMSEKDDIGTYYTPRAVVEWLSATVVDPVIGTGAYLAMVDLGDDGLPVVPAPMRCPNCDDADMVQVLDEQRGMPIWFCGNCHWEEDEIDFSVEEVP
jgi:hypothetical protein